MAATQERPIYRILDTHGFFGPDSHLYQEGETIYFDGEPNEEMEPMNEPAREALEKYFAKLEDGAKQLAAKAGVAYTGRPRSLEAAVELASLAARRTSTSHADGGIPLMGARNESAAANVGYTNAAPVPETNGRGKSARSGTLSLNKAQPLSKVAQTLA